MSDQTKTELTASLRSFDNAYQGTPPWDIGRPQAEIVRLMEQGAIAGRVLDVGSGTGENALYLAAQGLEVWGVDGAPRAVDKARAKAAEREIDARFLVGNALALQALDTRFDTVIDSGMFHTFSDEERRAFARSLAAVLRPGGRFYLLVWSEHEPGTWGPRRVTQAEIRETFDQGWTVCYVRESVYELNVNAGGSRAWLAAIERQGDFRFGDLRFGDGACSMDEFAHPRGKE
jgi:SAM-dependent methyltransferase